jgi:hypothetical protein
MKPLGLPEGSVRAIILIALTSAIVLPVFVFMFRQTDVPPGIREFLGMLAMADVNLIKDYITKRSADPVAPKEPEVVQ